MLLTARLMAQVRRAEGKLEEAERLGRDAWVEARDRLGEEHPHTLDAAGVYASVLTQRASSTKPRS
ncbi:MAG: hypothetical protein U1E76_27050 [Planctomycetota bacterium]